MADRQPDAREHLVGLRCPGRRARRSRRGGRDGRRRRERRPRGGVRPRRCWRRWGPAARARRRGSRRSGRRRCRRSRRRSTACTAPCRARSWRRSLVSVALTKSAAPGPLTIALPRWLTSKMPTASRTAVCSLTTPEGYSSGIDQPPNSANFAPSATWRSCSGDCLQGRVRPWREPTAALGDRGLTYPAAGDDDVHAAQRQPRQDPSRRRGRRRRSPPTRGPSLAARAPTSPRPTAASCARCSPPSA